LWGTGTGGESIYGRTFDDEWENGVVKHTQPLMLSMANAGENTNGSQFFLTTSSPLWHLDGKHVVFGIVASGEQHVRDIEAVGSRTGQPYRPVTIVDCGEVPAAASSGAGFESEVLKAAENAVAAALDGGGKGKGKSKGGGEASTAGRAAAAEREKLLKRVAKEGGKKGVEIEGAADMGGLDFFCTTLESPDGDVGLLEASMTAMNAEPDPDAEDRKGCSGRVGKMIFSAGVRQLAMVAYVPEALAEKVSAAEWLAHVCGAVQAEVVSPPAAAESPDGGLAASAVAKADADAGKFPLKDKDTAMAAAFAFLRSKGAFPEDNDDSEDEMVFGDDCNLDDYE